MAKCGEKLIPIKNKFRSLTIFEFQERFTDEDFCYAYLSELKWGTGFVCPNCGHTKYCNGKRKDFRQCTSCYRISSRTNGTLFHQLKFSALKAFYIANYVSTNKKGISSKELSRKLGLRQKICWKFNGKAMKARENSGIQKINGNAEVDETGVGGQEEGVVG